MKVIFINEDWRVLADECGSPLPKFMGEYNVIESKEINFERVKGYDGLAIGVYYILAEMEHDRYFHSSFFATLPAADADQMKEAVRESIVNLEHQPV